MSAADNQDLPKAAGVLVEDHAQVGDLIHELLAALDDGDKAKSFELLDLLWARLAVHIRAEHLCLFPAILDAPLTSFTGTGDAPQREEAHNAINLLRDDHDFFMGEMATAVNNMRKHETVSDLGVINKMLLEVRRTVVGIETRLDTHNQLEENQVYRWADVMLSQTDRATLTARMRRELANLPPRFTHVGENSSH